MIDLICGACGGPAVKRTSAKGYSFFGCSNFPTCTRGGTLAIDSYEDYLSRYPTIDISTYDPGIDIFSDALSRRVRKIKYLVAKKQKIEKLKKTKKQTISMEKIRKIMRDRYKTCTPKTYKIVDYETINRTDQQTTFDELTRIMSLF